MKNLKKIKLLFAMGEMICDNENVDLLELKTLTKMILSNIDTEIKSREIDETQKRVSEIIDELNGF